MNNYQRSLLLVNTALKPFNRNYRSDSYIRVRFAPSPTGFLHLGGLRTALYNYLFAKRKNGKFIIRIEDTDQKRLNEEAKDKLLNDLKWVGIEADEDPIKGGPFGPYIQSQKQQFYNVQANVLMARGHAYKCFCSVRRLDLLRKDCLKMRQVPKYDNKCRRLSPLDISDKQLRQVPYCIRFKMQTDSMSFKDLVFGEYKFNVAEHEGDPVIIKTDGLPTYHFANVVDDHFMKISHVFRGSEWLSSTNKHILIYNAFDWEPPVYGHLPLLLNPDGSKLSKRQNVISIDYYRRTGILPMALINFITEQGGGFEKDNKHRQCYSMEELISKFNIETIGRNSGRLNMSTLDEYNKLELLKQIQHPEKKKHLIKQLDTLIRNKYKTHESSLELDPKHLESVLLWSVKRISSVEDLVSKDLEFIWVLPINVDLWIKDELVLEQFLLELKQVTDFTSLNIKIILKKLCSEKNCLLPDIMAQIRKSLSGQTVGPGVGDMMEILGKDISMARIQTALTAHKKQK